MIIEILAGYAIGRASKNRRIRELEEELAWLEEQLYED